MRKILLLVFAALLSACAAQLSTAGAQVRTVKGDASPGCKELGTVEGRDSRLNTLSATQKFSGNRDAAYIKLRNRAGDMGATLVRIDQEGPEEHSDNVGVTLSYVIRGVAFNCPTP